MKITSSLASANTLILFGALMAATIVAAPLSLANGQSAWASFSAALVFAAPAVTLAGTVWSGWLALRKPRPHGFWSKVFFELGFVLCIIELFIMLWGALGIGAA
jgi:hypothetical protein